MSQDASTVRQVPLWLSIALTVIAALSLPTIAASLVGFLVSRQQERASAVEAQQRASVERVLEVVERVAHRQVSWAKYWSPPPAVDFVVAYPRLLLELGAANQPVAVWMWRQLQLMLAARTDLDVLQLGNNATAQLLQWQQHAIGPAWFQAELRRDPVADPFVDVRKLRRRTTRRAFLRTVAVLALGRFGLAVLKRLFR